MRYDSKQKLLADIRTEHDALCALLADIAEYRFSEPGVWGDGWTIHDLVAHLAEWQFMFLTWYRDGLRGAMPRMPAPGYKWNQMAELNRAVWLKHKAADPASARGEFEHGYAEILRIAEGLSEEQLLLPGHFKWTGKHGLTTYLGANTASHYRFALKVLRRWLKRTGRVPSVDA